MLKMIRPAIASLFIFTLITGIIYPLAVTAIAQLLFPFQANGSIILKDGKTAGSALIGQQFEGMKYFWGRPSATSPHPYNAAASSGSNLGQSNPALLKAIKERANFIHAAHPGNKALIPADLVFASASGLDPHISPAAAAYQLTRVAKARGMDEKRVRELVVKHTEDRLFGIFGEPGVNVLKLNMALDEIK